VSISAAAAADWWHWGSTELATTIDCCCCCLMESNLVLHLRRMEKNRSLHFSLLLRAAVVSFPAAPADAPLPAELAALLGASSPTTGSSVLHPDSRPVVVLLLPVAVLLGVTALLGVCRALLS
jgi:hypothetical protein